MLSLFLPLFYMALSSASKEILKPFATTSLWSPVSHTFFRRDGPSFSQKCFGPVWHPASNDCKSTAESGTVTNPFQVLCLSLSQRLIDILEVKRKYLLHSPHSLLTICLFFFFFLIFFLVFLGTYCCYLLLLSVWDTTNFT